jgi:hypothetical protein
LELSGRKERVRISLPLEFPSLPPKIRVLNSALYWLYIPHVQENGNLCLYTNASALMVDSPTLLLKDALERASKIIGSPDLSDFDDEIFSYWTKPYGDRYEVLVLTSDGRIPSDYWLFKASSKVIVSDDAEKLKLWCDNYGIWDETRVSRGSRIDLKNKLNPADYPNNVHDYEKLLEKNGSEEHLKELRNHLLSGQNDSIALLRYIGSKGKVDVAVCIPVMSLDTNSFSKGFRRGRMRAEVVWSRASYKMKSMKLGRLSIQPVHHNYIHSRGGNGEDFSTKKIVLVGCGALGSHVAHFLAKSGVGHLVLIDDQYLSWDNIGRHLLGALFVMKNKANTKAINL